MNNNEEWDRLGNEVDRFSKMMREKKTAEIQKTKEDLRARNLHNKKVAQQKKIDKTKFVLFNVVGTAIAAAVIFGGVAYAQAKDKLVKQRGGETFTDPRAGFTSVVGVEEPTVGEVLEFMFTGSSEYLGKGR